MLLERGRTVGSSSMDSLNEFLANTDFSLLMTTKISTLFYVAITVQFLKKHYNASLSNFDIFKTILLKNYEYGFFDTSSHR